MLHSYDDSGGTTPFKHRHTIRPGKLTKTRCFIAT